MPNTCIYSNVILHSSETVEYFKGISFIQLLYHQHLWHSVARVKYKVITKWAPKSRPKIEFIIKGQGIQSQVPFSHWTENIYVYMSILKYIRFQLSLFSRQNAKLLYFLQ